MAEVQKYSKEIKVLEQQYQDIKEREEEKLAEEIEDEDKGSDSGAGSSKNIRKVKKSSFFNQKNTAPNTDVNEKDFLLSDNANVDFERIKNMYPLRENGGDV